MKLWPCTTDAWNEYVRWYFERELPPPIHTDTIILVGDTEPTLGCSVFTCDGGYMLVEQFAAKPGIPRSELVRGSKLIVNVLKGQAQVRARVLLAMCAYPAMANMLEDSGFRRSDMVQMMYIPWIPEPDKNVPARDEADGDDEHTERRDAKSPTVSKVAAKKRTRKKKAPVKRKAGQVKT